MANPRAIVDFTDLNAHYSTFIIGTGITYSATATNGSASVGLAVTLTGEADGAVGLVADGEKVNGKLIKVDSDGFCTVQDGGYMELPGGTAATLTIGSSIVGDLLGAAEGYIQTGTAAGIARGSIVNNDTTTAVVVNLDV